MYIKLLKFVKPCCRRRAERQRQEGNRTGRLTVDRLAPKRRNK